MAETNKPIVALIRKDGDTVAERLKKALSAFAEVLELSFANTTVEELQTIAAEQPKLAATFLDQELVSSDWDLSTLNPVLYNTKNIPLKEIILNSGNTALLKYSCLSIHNAPLQDMMRVLHNFINKKSLSGVYPFVERGSLIVGEKIHSQDSVGACLDQVVAFLHSEHPALAPRANDIRQMMTALTGEAVLRTQETNLEYNNVDLQFCAAPDKFIFTVRFPLGKVSLKTLPALCNQPIYLPWFLAAQGSDLLVLTEFTQFQEVEVKAFIFAGRKPSSELTFRSILTQSTSTDQKSSNLLTPPKNYTFSLISDLKNNQKNRQKAQEDIKDEIEEAKQQKTPKLDPVTKLKITTLENQLKTLQTQLEQKEAQVRQGLAMVTEAKNTMVQKRSETVKLLKSHENTTQVLRNQIAEYEKKLTSASKQLEQNAKFKSERNTGQEKTSQFEAQIKSLEHEKRQAHELVTSEQKKTDTIEKKYQQSRADVANKEKEILELKQQMEQLKKETQKAISASGSSDTSKKDNNSKKETSGAEKELLTKVRELTGKEEGYKQEIKKLNFKIDSLEKTAKANQGGDKDKIKLLEKKLEEAKIKEIELLKKAEELAQQAKKAPKAA